MSEREPDATPPPQVVRQGGGGRCGGVREDRGRIRFSIAAPFPLSSPDPPQYWKEAVGKFMRGKCSWAFRSAGGQWATTTPPPSIHLVTRVSRHHCVAGDMVDAAVRHG